MALARFGGMVSGTPAFEKGKGPRNLRYNCNVLAGIVVFLGGGGTVRSERPRAVADPPVSALRFYTLTRGDGICVVVVGLEFRGFRYRRDSE